MYFARIPLLLTTVASALLAAAAHAQGEAGQRNAASADATLEEVLILGVRENRTSKGATGLDLSLADTPQSVTVMDRETLDQFGLDEINDVLRLTTGVNVEATETDRTYYNARGFDILSMQVDGVGMPYDDLVTGALDSAAYDKIEVVRGANGLLTGTGNPSGTINYARKRPTNEFMALGEVTFGTWDRKRVEMDVSLPLAKSGRWAARVVVAAEDKETWLDFYAHERKLFYGVVDGQLGERTTLAVGYTRQDSESDGVMWGALPLLYTDGTQAEFDASTTITMPWTYWDVHTNSAFAEVAVQLSKDWQFKSVLTYNTSNKPSELFWTYPSSMDRDTGLGLYGWPGKFEEDAHALLSDTSLSGGFDLWGRSHEATLGLNLSKSHSRSQDYPDPAIDSDPYYYAMPAFPGWTGTEVARPAFGTPYLAAESKTHLNRLYGAARLSATDAVKLILGFNAVDAKSEGFSWGTPANKSERAFSPYLGATWRLTASINVYASYSDIYQPQSVVNVNLQPLGSAKGKSYEAGVKGEWLDRRLLTTLAVFKADQNNLQQFTGYTGTDFTAYYEGIDVRSRGYEIEVAGKPHDSLKLQAGYTHVRLEDPQGRPTRTFIPRDTLKLLATWQVPFAPALKLGAAARWQDEIYYDADLGRVRQPAYAVFDVNGVYRFGEHLELRVGVDNVADEKYLGSLMYDQTFYGEPRNYSVSSTYRF